MMNFLFLWYKNDTRIIYNVNVCQTVYDGDPLSDGEMRGYDKKLVEKRYIEMGCEAVVVY